MALPVGFPSPHGEEITEAHHPTFQVMNPDEELPEKFRTKITDALLERVRTAYAKPGRRNVRPYLLNLLRWLDNRLEALLVDQHDTTNFQAKAQGIELVGVPTKPVESAAPQEPASGEGSGSDSSDDSYEAPAWLVPQMQHMGLKTEASDSEGESSDPSDDESVEGSAGEDVAEGEIGEGDSKKPPVSKRKDDAYAATTAHRGTQVVLSNLFLMNVGIMDCTTLVCVGACTRCRVQSEFSLSAGSGVTTVECHNCHTMLGISFRSEKMHEMGMIIGYLEVEPVGCVNILEVLSTSAYAVHCFECGEVMKNVKDIPIATGSLSSLDCFPLFSCCSLAVFRAYLATTLSRMPQCDGREIRNHFIPSNSSATVAKGDR
jgi:ribosomal protein S27E